MTLLAFTLVSGRYTLVSQLPALVLHSLNVRVWHHSINRRYPTSGAGVQRQALLSQHPKRSWCFIVNRRHPKMLWRQDIGAGASSSEQHALGCEHQSKVFNVRHQLPNTATLGANGPSSSDHFQTSATYVPASSAGLLVRWRPNLMRWRVGIMRGRHPGGRGREMRPSRASRWATLWSGTARAARAAGPAAPRGTDPYRGPPLEATSSAG